MPQLPILWRLRQPGKFLDLKGPTVTAVDAQVVDVTGNGVVSSEALGVPAITRTVAPIAIASGEALGAVTIRLTVTPTGIASAGAFGVPSISRSVAPSTIASGEAVGTPAIARRVTVASIGSAEAVGAPSVGDVVAAAGVASAEALGTPAIVVTVSVVGIESGEVVARPAVDGGIPSGFVAGGGFITVIHVDHDASEHPDPILRPSTQVTTQGIASSAAVGTPRVLVARTLLVAGIASEEAVNAAEITRRASARQRRRNAEQLL